MTRRVILSSLLLASASLLGGCDTFREVHLAPHRETGAVLAPAGDADVDKLVDAVRKVAAEKKLQCIDNPQPGTMVGCGAWFHNLSVTVTGGSPIIEIHLAHPGWSFGHDSDCDLIADLVQNFRTLLGPLDVTPLLGKCDG